jgi:signal transduction histidine kinase
MDPERAWQAVRRHPVLGDALPALGLALLALAMLLIDPDGRASYRPAAADVAGFVLALAAVTARRRFTGAALIASVTAELVFLAVDREQPMLTAAIALLLYTYATRTGRRTAWLVAGGVAAVLVLAGLSGGAGNDLGALAWIGTGTAIGEATRSRLAYVAEVEERARRAEESREEDARLRVVQERMRIARELHDVVAHHIAVVKVQASGAKHVLAHHPDRVGPALDSISRSSDAVLREIASVIGMLRVAPDPDPGLAPDPVSRVAPESDRAAEPRRDAEAWPGR